MMTELGGSDPQQTNQSVPPQCSAATGDGQPGQSAPSAVAKAAPINQASATAAQRFERIGQTDPKGPPDDPWGPVATPNYLIMRDKRFIVYLDEDDDIDWRLSAEYEKELDDRLKESPQTEKSYGAALNRLALLQSVPVRHLGRLTRREYRRLVGEGLARMLDTFDFDNAQSIFDKAEQFVTARNQETARIWYLTGSGGAFVLVLACLAVLGLKQNWWTDNLGPTLFLLLVGTCFGSVGAMLSILQRVGQSPLDPNAGARLHYIEGGVRIFVGMLGATLIALAVRLGLINLEVKSDPDRVILVVFLCIVAGASERLVPSFIQRVEVQASGAATSPPADQPAPEPNKAERQLKKQ
jgi:hypothetical protein